MGISTAHPNIQVCEEDRWIENWYSSPRNLFWLLCLIAKTSQHGERQLTAIGYVLKICGNLLAIKATNSYLRAWGHCCGHLPGLLIRFVGGVEFAAMWWMILSSHRRDKPGKHYCQGLRFWVWSLKCKIINTPMPAAESNSKNVTLLASFLSLDLETQRIYALLKA